MTPGDFERRAFRLWDVHNVSDHWETSMLSQIGYFQFFIELDNILGRKSNILREIFSKKFFFIKKEEISVSVS